MDSVRKLMSARTKIRQMIFFEKYIDSFLIHQFLNLYFQVIWIAITIILIHLRQKAKKSEKRELAESLEDARIFASSRHIMDGGFPHPGTMPLNNIKNGMTPNDQVRKMYPVDYAISTINFLF